MRFLVDASLSFRVAEALRKDGHDAVHVWDVLTVDASDPVIFEDAADDGRVVVSADTDFGELLARRRTARPSLVLLRGQTRRRPSAVGRRTRACCCSRSCPRSATTWRLVRSW